MEVFPPATTSELPFIHPSPENQTEGGNETQGVAQINQTASATNETILDQPTSSNTSKGISLERLKNLTLSLFYHGDQSHYNLTPFDEVWVETNGAMNSYVKPAPKTTTPKVSTR